MPIKDNVLAYIDRKLEKICDDCMTKQLKLTQRQVAFRCCTDLYEEGRINRERNMCSFCGKYKNCSWSKDNSLNSGVTSKELLSNSVKNLKEIKVDTQKDVVKSINPIIEKHIIDFMNVVLDRSVEVYNEFSLQHELGIYLRTNLGDKYKIQFERNVSFFNIIDRTLKKEMDIVLYTPDLREKYCIELKYPTNGQYPEQMFSMCKDIKFLEQLKSNGFTGGYSVNLVDSLAYCNGTKSEGIYVKFRDEKRLYGKIEKPTGAKDERIEFSGEYNIKWISKDDKTRYFIVNV